MGKEALVVPLQRWLAGRDSALSQSRFCKKSERFLVVTDRVGGTGNYNSGNSKAVRFGG